MQVLPKRPFSGLVLPYFYDASAKNGAKLQVRKEPRPDAQEASLTVSPCETLLCSETVPMPSSGAQPTWCHVSGGLGHSGWVPFLNDDGQRKR